MTEEQIKQNAEAYAEEHAVRTDGGGWEEEYDYEEQEAAYIAGAHSRDEEISLMQNALEIQARILRERERNIQKLRNPWISVEVNLPDPHTPVYAKNDRRTWFFALRTNNRVRPWYDIVGRHPEEVTHWKPIPQIEKE